MIYFSEANFVKYFLNKQINIKNILQKTNKTLTYKQLQLNKKQLHLQLCYKKRAILTNFQNLRCISMPIRH